MPDASPNPAKYGHVRSTDISLPPSMIARREDARRTPVGLGDDPAEVAVYQIRLAADFANGLHHRAKINGWPLSFRQNQATGNQQWLAPPPGVSKCNRFGRTISSTP